MAAATAAAAFFVRWLAAKTDQKRHDSADMGDSPGARNRGNLANPPFPLLPLLCA